MSQYRAFSRAYSIGAFFSLAFMVNTRFTAPWALPITTGTPSLIIPAFLFGNLRQRVTQILGVVEAYVGDNTQIRMDDIRTVQIFRPCLLR